MNPEAVTGTIYKFNYIGGRPYDPEQITSNGVFLKKVSLEGQEYYLVAQKFLYKMQPNFYIYYLSKSDIQNALGRNTDEDFADLLKAIESPDYKHPKYLRQYLTPYILISKEEVDKLSGKTAARKKLQNFMTQAIYAPPIRNVNNKVLFTGGPMYKRALARFSSRGGKTRKRSNKKRNTRRKH